MAAPKASSMEELQTRGFSVMMAPGNTASPAVGKSQGVANIPKTSPIIDITGSGAPSAGGGFCDLFATSGKSVDAVRKATSTLDTETTLRLVCLERLAKEAEKKADEESEKAKTEAKAEKKAGMETMPSWLRAMKNKEILRQKAAAKAEKKAAAKAEKKAKEEVKKAKADAKAEAAKKKALEEAMELAEEAAKEAAKEAARLEAAKAAEEAAKLETEKAAKEAARTKALKEAEAAHLVKLKAAEEENVAAEAARKANEEAERLEAEKNAEAQTLAAKAKIELSAALMAAAKAKEAQEAARAMVPKDADIPKKVIGTDGKGQVGLLRHTLGKRGSLWSQEKPPAKRSSMFLEEDQFFSIGELKFQRLERKAAKQKKLATADSRRHPKPSAVGEPSNLSNGVTEQGPPSFLPEAASTAAARLSMEDALRRGPNSEEFGRVLADNERLWKRVQTMEKKINRMSRDIKIILERQPLPPPPMPKPAAATTSTMTGVERDGVRLHALIAQHNRLSAQIAVTVSQMSDIIAGENK